MKRYKKLELYGSNFDFPWTFSILLHAYIVYIQQLQRKMSSDYKLFTVSIQQDLTTTCKQPRL